MTKYEKNLKLIKSKNPKVYDSIAKKPVLFEVNLQRVEGSLNLIVEYKGARCFLHSIYDINDELEMMFADADRESEALIMYGFGLGQSVDYIKEKYKNLKQFILIEPSSQIFNALLNEVEFEELLLKMGKATIIVNQNPDDTTQIIFNALISDKINKVAFVSGVPYVTLFNEHYNLLTASLVKNLRALTGTINALDYRKQMWLTNSLINLKFDSCEFSNIAPIFKGRPAVIVSAGPSIKKHLHLIEELKKKAIVIAVGSSIKILEKNGIKPHFRIAVDSSEEEKDVVVNEIDTAVPLIYSNVLFHEILPEYRGRQIHAMMEYDWVSRYVYAKAEIPWLTINTACSVANSTVHLLGKAGCSHVIFIGQDMCYIDDKLYPESAGVNEDRLLFAMPEIIHMKDIFGNDVRTLNTYVNIKYNFDEDVPKYPAVRFINATEGGLGIETTEIIPLQEVMDNVLTKNLGIDLDFELEKVMKKNVSERKRRLTKAMKAIEKEIEEATELNAKRFEKAKELYEDLEKGTVPANFPEAAKFFNEIEREMDKIGFYHKVVKVALEAHIVYLRRYFKSSSNEQDKVNEADLKYILNFSAEVFSYMYMANVGMAKYKGAIENKELGEVHESTPGNL